MAVRILVDGVDLAATNIELQSLTPSDSDLGQQISTASFVIDEEKQVTAKVPQRGQEVLIYDDDGTTLIFGGFIRDLTHVPQPVRRRWSVECQDYNVRAFETATGSLNKSGIVDSDRNFVIAIFRDALKAQVFGSGTGLDDPIITANEPNWPGVQGTTNLSGLDFSYKSPKSAMEQLTAYIPGVFWRVGPDKVLTYGYMRDLAPFAVHTTPTLTGLKPFENYHEQILVGEHCNKMRRAGAAASEATAYDEVSYAILGRILDAGYADDTTVPAGDVRRRAYAELETRPIRVRANFRVRDKGLRAGQLIDVVNERIGSGTLPAPFPNAFLEPLMATSTTRSLAGERGRFLITKVTTRPLGRQNYIFDVECGDDVRDIGRQLAVLAGTD